MAGGDSASEAMTTDSEMEGTTATATTAKKKRRRSTAGTDSGNAEIVFSELQTFAEKYGKPQIREG